MWLSIVIGMSKGEEHTRAAFLPYIMCHSLSKHSPWHTMLRFAVTLSRSPTDTVSPGKHSSLPFPNYSEAGTSCHRDVTEKGLLGDSAGQWLPLTH